MEAGCGDQTCILWEGNEATSSKTLTYQQVLDETCRLVSGLLQPQFCRAAHPWETHLKEAEAVNASRRQQP